MNEEFIDMALYFWHSSLGEGIFYMISLILNILVSTTEIKGEC
jgi:hypothetical protein